MYDTQSPVQQQAVTEVTEGEGLMNIVVSHQGRHFLEFSYFRDGCDVVKMKTGRC